MTSMSGPRQLLGVRGIRAGKKREPARLVCDRARRRRATACGEWKRLRIGAVLRVVRGRAGIGCLTSINAAVQPRRCSIGSCSPISRPSSPSPTIRQGRACPGTRSGVSASTWHVAAWPTGSPVPTAQNAATTSWSLFPAKGARYAGRAQPVAWRKAPPTQGLVCGGSRIMQKDV